MPGKNKNPLLGWHCPAELADWARSEAEQRKITLAALLTDALTQYRRRNGNLVVDAYRQEEAADQGVKLKRKPVVGYSKERQARGKR